MLSGGALVDQGTDAVVKQGFLFKKGGSGLLAKWRLKFATVIARGDGSYVMLIYDKRNQTVPPKHYISLKRGGLIVDKNQPSRASRLFKTGTPQYPFTVIADSRKYHLSAQSRSEQEEWVHALHFCLSPDKALPLRMQTLTRQNSVRFVGRIDEDAVSTYSEDSVAMSVVSQAAYHLHQHAAQHQQMQNPYQRQMQAAYQASHQDLHGEMHSLSSALETLSFNSEPVLTQNELAAIGANKDLNMSLATKRRAAQSSTQSLSSYAPNWCQQYQELMALQAPTDESMMKKDLSMIDLIGCFQETAQSQVKSAVDSLHWKSNKQEITAWEWSKEGIHYKFLVDYEETASDVLYAAHVQANHELQAIDYFNTSSADLRTELMCIVDYKGFRVVATAEKPHKDIMTGLYELQGEKPLVDEEVSHKLARIGHELHLKPHAVMLRDDRRVTIPLGAGFKAFYDGKSNLTYVTDLNSLLPMHYDVASARNSGEMMGDAMDLPVTRNKRLRPEFLAEYPHPLCADAFTKWSAGVRRDRQENDEEVEQASSFLREHWIPAFVRKLDHLEIRPMDSQEFTAAFHKAGVNMHFLGLVARLSTIGFVKDLCHIEMVARTIKNMFRTRIRAAILHFKAVGATQIEEELSNYAANIFSLVLCGGEKRAKFFVEKLRGAIEDKFAYDMEFDVFGGLYPPALMQALQFHCGMYFEDNTLFDFTMPLPKSKVVGFKPRAKFVWMRAPKRMEDLLKSQTTSSVPKDEILAYQLSRHFKSLGPASKLSRLNSSARALINVACYYNSHARYEEAKMYAQAASNAALQGTCVQGLAMGQMMESMCGLQSDTSVSADPNILTLYHKALTYVESQCNKNSLWSMALHDRVCAFYLKCHHDDEALKYLDLSLRTATNHLGKHHFLTAGYMVKTGVILKKIGQIHEAYQSLTEALHIYQALQSDVSLIAEAHYHLAEVLLDKGDNDGAVTHAQRAKKLRERCFGQQDARTIESYRQVSKLIMHPFQNYKGVVTPQIRTAYREVIQNHEKVFRFLKNMRPSGGSSSANQERGTHRRSLSQMSTFSIARSVRSVNGVSSVVSSNDLNAFVLRPVTGPYFSAPYADREVIGRSLMHKLAKQIILLKLDLVEQPNHKECVRQLRLELEQNGMTLTPEEARDVIFKMAAVSPSVYLDGLLSRIDEEDEDAEYELGIVLQLVEKETLGLASSN